MTDMPNTNRPLRVGDYITFRAAVRDHCRTATRKVVGFDQEGRPLVRYWGYRDFVVRLSEVVKPQEANNER